MLPGPLASGAQRLWREARPELRTTQVLPTVRPRQAPLVVRLRQEPPMVRPPKVLPVVRPPQAPPHHPTPPTATPPVPTAKPKPPELPAKPTPPVRPMQRHRPGQVLTAKPHPLRTQDANRKDPQPTAANAVGRHRGAGRGRAARHKKKRANQR